MANTIKCPNCGKQVEISDAFKREIEEQIIAVERRKAQEQISAAVRQAEEKAEAKIQGELASKFKLLEEEANEEKQRNKRLLQQLEDLMRQMRELRREREEQKLKVERQMAEKETKIWQEAREKSVEEQKLKIKERDLQIEQLRKALEEAQRRAAQGSQQIQGEILELDLEELLKKEFPNDIIEPVGKGVGGADIRQIVRSLKGVKCGVILWELKRTKNWSDKWIAKLKDDLRAEVANIPVIVSEALPEEAKAGIGMKENIWICSPKFAIYLALLFRQRLLDVGYEKAINAYRGEKADLVYAFVTSHEFRQQVEAIVEVHKEMREQVERERRVFTKSWQQREAQLKRMLLSTAVIYGKLQGIAGKGMPQIKGLELLELESGN